MKNIFLLVWFLIFSISGSTFAQSNAQLKEKIKKAHLSFIDGILAENYSTVGQLLADNVTLGFPDGGFTAKKEYINALKNKTLYYDSSANQLFDIRVYGNIGVVNGTGELLFRYKDAKGEWYKMLEHLTYTAVYLIDKDEVLMVSWQSNRPTGNSTIKLTQLLY